MGETSSSFMLTACCPFRRIAAAAFITFGLRLEGLGRCTLAAVDWEAMGAALRAGPSQPGCQLV